MNGSTQMPLVRIAAALIVFIALAGLPTPASASGLTLDIVDSSDIVTAGAQVTLTVSVRNVGDQTVSDADFVVTLAGSVSRATWTAAYTSGAFGPTIGASGPDTLLTLPSGSAATFTIAASVASDATGDFVTTASVTHAGQTVTDTDTQEIYPNEIIVSDSYAVDGAQNSRAGRNRPGVAPSISLLDPATGAVLSEFRAFESGHRGGVHTALGDLDGDGRAEIIAVPGPGRTGEVRVFRVDLSDMSSPDVARDPSVVLRPFGSRYRGGLAITSADFNGDGRSDIAIARASGAGMVRVFLSRPTGEKLFVPYRAFRPGIHFGPTGITLAAGDFGAFDGASSTPGLPDGRAELVVAGGKGSSTQVQVRDASRADVPTLDVIRSVRAPRDGVHVAVGRVSKDSIPDLIIATRERGHARIVVLDGVVDRRANEQHTEFTAGRPETGAPIFTATVDADSDGWADTLHVAWMGKRGAMTSRHALIHGRPEAGEPVTVGPGEVRRAPSHGRLASFTPAPPAIVTTPTGLQYRDVVAGTGARPTGPDSTVVVNYTGWLLDGTQIDQGASARFALGSVIEGWSEGIATMRVGGRRQLIVPAHLAYGAAGTATIPPDSTLVFDIELLSTAP